MSQACRRVRMSRQNYYQGCRRRQRQQINENLIVEKVQQARQFQSRLGTRKTGWLIASELQAHGIRIGRDRLFDLLRRKGMLIKPLPKKPRTTFSRHSLPVFTNQIRDLELTRPNQVWVSDITYIPTRQGYLYLALTTDKMSRKIIGYDVAEGLEAIGAIRAAKMALAQLPKGVKVIHHSDRGCQYCCHDFADLLKEREVQISMTETNHCYENSVAERVNGILKQEYGLGWELPNKALAIKLVTEAIHLYNNCRPHTALNYAYPSQVHASAA